MARKRDPRDPSAALPFMELPFFNSLGGFTPDGREYAIYLGPNMHTPAPWTNVIANPAFGTIVSETGAGFTWQGNSQRNRLTQWSNDPVMDPSSEAIYIRDEDTGIYWTPTASPIREETAYRARHGAGYTVFEHNSHGIEQELTVFVPVDDEGGQPIKLQKLTLRNDSGRPRKLSVTYYVEWTLGEARESSQMHIVTSWDDEVRALLARNHYHPDYGDQVAFAAVSAPTASYTGDRTAFIGRNGSLRSPAGMERTRLSRRTGAGLDPCAALQVSLKLAPGECAEITCMLGQAPSVEQVHALVLAYRNSLALETALRQTQAWWEDRLGTIQVHTPELATDIMINRWLLYQSLSCRIWGRSGFYQSGGAFGFRDQLQDVMALLYAPSRVGARAHPARGQPSVQGRRCSALVAPTGRRGHPLADLGRSVVASLRGRAIPPDHRRCQHPARGGPLPRRTPAQRRSARELPNAGRFAPARHALRTLPAGARPQPALRRPWLAPDGNGGTGTMG